MTETKQQTRNFCVLPPTQAYRSTRHARDESQDLQAMQTTEGHDGDTMAGWGHEHTNTHVQATSCKLQASLTAKHEASAHAGSRLPALWVGPLLGERFNYTRWHVSCAPHVAILPSDAVA